MLLIQTTASTVVSDLIRSHLASYSVSLAIQGPFLVAIGGAALLLRRPGMRALFAAQGLFSAAFAMSAVAFWLRGSSNSEVSQLPALQVTIFLFGAASWAMHHALLCFAGRRSNPWPNAWRTVGAGAAAAAVLPILIVVSRFASSPSLLRVVGVRALLAGLVGFIVIDGLRMSSQAPRNRVALRMIAFAAAALLARQLFGLFSEWEVARGNPVSNVAVVLTQTSTTVLNGVALLAAVLIEERSAIFAQAAQLREASLRLARSEQLESLGQMAGGIAHDFANVLSVIGVGVSEARAASPSPEVTTHLIDVEDAVDRATGLTRQLRLFAQQRPPETVDFAAEARLQAMAPVLQRLAGARVSLTVSCDPNDNTHIEMDPSQFDQVVFNLVVNARDAMPTGGTIAMRAGPRVIEAGAPASTALAPGRYLELTVSDIGGGIPEELLERIFEPFYTSKGDRGTGLGLATVQSVVRHARGHVRVQSDPTGTRFEVLIPAAA
jgi:signal transduction histidine kinase